MEEMDGTAQCRQEDEHDETPAIAMPGANDGRRNLVWRQKACSPARSTLTADISAEAPRKIGAHNRVSGQEDGQRDRARPPTRSPRNRGTATSMPHHQRMEHEEGDESGVIDSTVNATRAEPCNAARIRGHAASCVL